MNEEKLNISIEKFLKNVGITSWSIENNIENVKSGKINNSKQ